MTALKNNQLQGNKALKSAVWEKYSVILSFTRFDIHPACCLIPQTTCPWKENPHHGWHTTFVMPLIAWDSMTLAHTLPLAKNYRVHINLFAQHNFEFSQGL